MKLYNIFGLFKKNEIKLVEKRSVTQDSYLFSFKFDPGLDWKAGKHGMFTFRGEKLDGGNFRPFSVASTKKENKITIATKIGDKPSKYKTKLKSMEIGDSISLRGPFGGFYISDYNRPTAMIAGGIGITPMRALLKDIEDKDNLKEIELFYIDSGEEYVFKDELEAIEQNNPSIKIHLLTDRKDLEDNIFKFINKYNNNAVYFISGNPKMVKDIRNKIRNKGIMRKNIINEGFMGYK